MMKIFYNNNEDLFFIKEEVEPKLKTIDDNVILEKKEEGFSILLVLDKELEEKHKDEKGILNLRTLEYKVLVKTGIEKSLRSVHYYYDSAICMKDSPVSLPFYKKDLNKKMTIDELYEYLDLMIKEGGISLDTIIGIQKHSERSLSIHISNLNYEEIEDNLFS